MMGVEKMSYQVKINTPCANPEETAVVTAAALAAMEGVEREYNLVVKPLRRLPVKAPIWNVFGRHERLERKFNT